ncbi:hypothetical protein [Cryptosporangium aurantiacum]|uniref:Uncharacterized protein n=1 Tax=Cryptosporangium aurantiacum TaxID=134849 RepID=A0A1M7RPE5_9ACTN|nr:hypothetical protein [Cryptosporangium aurantiacum]SHN48237.1 hypothetical protein SAMN05443668_1389 [Cryptosporangium aurantiacum]
MSGGLPAPVAAIAGALLRSAARRWPDEERADAHREWEAELHAIEGSRLRRSARALRYAASLAVASPPQAPQRDGVRPRAGSGRVTVLAAVGGPIVVCFGVLVVIGAFERLVPVVYRLSFGWIAIAIVLTLIPIGVAVAAWKFGGLVGRRLGTTSSWVRIVLMAVGLVLLVPPIGAANYASLMFTEDSLRALVAAAVLVVGVAATSGLARRSRPAAIVAVLVIADIAVALVGLVDVAVTDLSPASSPLWFPQVVFWPWEGPLPESMLLLSNSSQWLGSLLPTAAFAVAGYGVAMTRAAGREAAVPVAVPA